MNSKPYIVNDKGGQDFWCAHCKTHTAHLYAFTPKWLHVKCDVCGKIHRRFYKSEEWIEGILPAKEKPKKDEE